MSIWATLRLEFCCEKYSAPALRALLASSWKPQPEGWWHTELAPDEWDEWQLTPRMDASSALRLFNAKIQEGKCIAVRLFWEGGEVGCDFFFHPGKTLDVGCGINRVQLPEIRLTDASWYIARLLPVFLNQRSSGLQAWFWNEIL